MCQGPLWTFCVGEEAPISHPTPNSNSNSREYRIQAVHIPSTRNSKIVILAIATQFRSLNDSSSGGKTGMVDSVKGLGIWYNYRSARESLGYPSESSCGPRLFISITVSRVVLRAGVVVERCPPVIASYVLRNNLQPRIDSNIITKTVAWLMGVSDCVWTHGMTYSGHSIL